MFEPFPMMFHPTLIVEDLEESATWFRRVFGRKEVRWEEKWDISLLNPDYPINYSYFYVLGDVCLDVLAPSLLVLPGDREAVYPKGEGLADIAWYTSRISDVSAHLEKNSFRTRDQEGNVLHNGNVPESPLVADCPMIWTLPEDTGLTYEFYQMAERHWEKYSRRADPRLSPEWKPGVVDPNDPLSMIGSSAHTILTEDPDRALRLYVDVLGAQISGKDYNERLDADSVFVKYARSVLEFAKPRTGPILDVLTGDVTQSDQYHGITFEVEDIDKVSAHLRNQDVEFSVVGNGIFTNPAKSKGAVWGFVPTSK